MKMMYGLALLLFIVYQLPVSSRAEGSSDVSSDVGNGIVPVESTRSTANTSELLNTTINLNNSLDNTTLLTNDTNMSTTAEPTTIRIQLHNSTFTLEPFNISDEENSTESKYDYFDIVNNTKVFNDTGIDDAEEGDEAEEQGDAETPDTWGSLEDLANIDYCTCDLKVGECDIGCCCDEDCSNQDRRAFVSCTNVPRILSGGGDWCYQQWMLQRHSTEYAALRTLPGIFCLHTDNNPTNTRFLHVKAAHSLEEFTALKEALPARPQHSAGPAPEDSHDTVYRQGAPVMAVNADRQIFQLGLPSSLFSSECGSVTKLLYLHDQHFSCWQPLHIAMETKPHTFVNFFLLTRPLAHLRATPTTVTSTDSAHTSTVTEKDATTPNPDLNTITELDIITQQTPTVNASTDTTTPAMSVALNMTSNNNEDVNQTFQRTSITNSTESNKLLSSLLSSPIYEWLNIKEDLFNFSILIKVQISLCRIQNHEIKKADAVVCSVVEDADSLIGLDDNLVVKNVQYTIYHNGTDGIKAVNAKIFLENTEDLLGSIEQSFSVVYRWIKNEDLKYTEQLVERSGRPGYIRGKPVLLGQLIRNTTEKGDVLEAIATSPDISLSLLTGRGKDSLCGGQRQQVTFGDNFQSVCRIRVNEGDITESCDELRSAIVSQLLGPLLEEKDLRVASYGDSDTMRPTEWVPLLRSTGVLSEDYDEPLQLSEEGRCPDMILSVHLEVAYALQGSRSNPQARVTGVLLTTGTPQLSPTTLCVGVLCSTDATLRSVVSQSSDDTKQNRTFNLNIMTVKPEEYRTFNENDQKQSNSENSTNEVTYINIDLMSSVEFLDFSEPAELLYPELPSLDLKIPYDFFYPYLPSTAAIISQKHVLDTVVLSIVHLIFNLSLLNT